MRNHDSRRLARRRLREIRAYIARDKPEAAERLATRIVLLVETLRRHPFLGRSGSQAETRELVIGGTTYIVIYRVRGKRVTVSTIWHGAQRHEKRR